MRKIFYAYFLIDPRKGQIIYVGKGHDYRSEVHRYLTTEGRHYNKKLQNKINKIRSCGLEIISKIVFESPCEDAALMREAALICIIGLKNLCNLTANFKGGRFGMTSPFAGRKHTEKTKQKTSAKLKGKSHSKEHNRKVSLALKGHPFSGISFDRTGTKNSPESNRKRRLAQLGKPKKKKRGPLSAAHRQKLREAQRRRRKREKGILTGNDRPVSSLLPR